MTKLELPFYCGSTVLIERANLIGSIVGINITGGGRNEIQYNVRYWHNGEVNSAWCYAGELVEANERDEAMADNGGGYTKRL